MPYREERHLQVIHWAHIWRAGRGWTAPVLVTPKGPLRESAQIVRFADAHADLGLYRNPLAAALEARFDAAARPRRAHLDVPPDARAAGPHARPTARPASRAGSGPGCR